MAARQRLPRSTYAPRAPPTVPHSSVFWNHSSPIRLEATGAAGGGGPRHYLGVTVSLTPGPPVFSLHLVRHGIAQGAEGRAMGISDPPLAPEGRDQVTSLSRRWTEIPTALVSSDLRRARETADLLAAPWGLEVSLEPRLREMDFGEWDGRLWTDLERDDADRLRAWRERWVTAPSPAGESFSDLAARVRSWFGDLERGAAPPRLLVVAHAGSIRALLCHLHRVPLEKAFDFEVHRAQVITLQLDQRFELISSSRAT